MTAAVEVRVMEDAGIPVAALDGEVDLANAADVRGQIFGMVSNAAPGLVLDLSGVTYLDSRGVQLILELAERLKMRHLKFRIALPEKSLIRRILLLTHVDAVVPLDTSVEEALALMRAE
ncbi:MAG TPA: STAS domain-containing protein [bacterium]|nr:STAS domain-containing protein [bacterium]